MEKQSTHFICIIYPEKHSGTILLSYEAPTKQFVSFPSKFGPTSAVALGASRVNHKSPTELSSQVFYDLSIVILFEKSLEKLLYRLFLFLAVYGRGHALFMSSVTISRSSKNRLN